LFFVYSIAEKQVSGLWPQAIFFISEARDVEWSDSRRDNRCCTIFGSMTCKLLVGLTKSDLCRGMIGYLSSFLSFHDRWWCCKPFWEKIISLPAQLFDHHGCSEEKVSTIFF
jgi:hypothetical protein